MPFFIGLIVGLVVGSVLTVFLSLLTLHYTKIEARKAEILKKADEFKFRHQDNNSEPESVDVVSEGSNAE